MGESFKSSEHALFDRRWLHRSRLPTSTRKKFLSSYRTAYTTLITIFIAHYWEFGSSSATYVGPLLSAISGVDAYFGQWQNDFWKVVYASVFGNVIGLAIGYAYRYNYVQIILLFLALTWVNRISLWDRLGKIVGALSVLLGSEMKTYCKRFVTHGALFSTLCRLTSIFKA